MNWAWWDGKMSFEHYREEHGLDSETLLESARAEAGKENDSGREPAAAEPKVNPFEERREPQEESVSTGHK
jgi:hypothetical protein